MVSTARRLRGRFALTAPRPWDPQTAVTELVVQFGHLALCLLRRRGVNVTTVEDPDRPITNVGDELADVLLAVLSVAVLAEPEPEPEPGPGLRPSGRPTGDEAGPERESSGEIDGLLWLLISAGALAEAALVDGGYRHHPTGRLAPVTEATWTVVGACAALASDLGVDLLTEFRVMVADADSFLDAALGGEDR